MMTALQGLIDFRTCIALKLTLGLQNLCSFFRFALFDGEIYPLEPISKVIVKKRMSTDRQTVIYQTDRSIDRYKNIFLLVIFFCKQLHRLID